MEIRAAQAADVAGMLAIHNQVVASSTAIYEEQPSTLAQRMQWFETRQAQGFPVLVACEAGQVLGYASFGEWRSRWGYRFTVEHTVHVSEQARGSGLGRSLMQALLPLARESGRHVMIGAVDAQNLGSIRFHERLGFTPAGTCREVGHKFGRWLDLVFMQLILEPPAP